MSGLYRSNLNSVYIHIQSRIQGRYHPLLCQIQHRRRRRGVGLQTLLSSTCDNKLAAAGEAEEGQKEPKGKRDTGIEDGHTRLPFCNSGLILAAADDADATISILSRSR